MSVITEGETKIALNLKQICDSLRVAIQTIETGEAKQDGTLIQQGIASANIFLFEGTPVKEIKKLMKQENYR